MNDTTLETLPGDTLYAALVQLYKLADNYDAWANDTNAMPEFHVDMFYKARDARSAASALDGVLENMGYYE